MTRVMKDHHAVFGLSDPHHSRLLAAYRLPSIAYVKLFSPIARSFSTACETAQQDGGQHLDTQGAETRNRSPRSSNSRVGRPAQLAYCGAKTKPIALDAYQKPVLGFTSQVWQAELHHRPASPGKRPAT